MNPPPPPPPPPPPKYDSNLENENKNNNINTNNNNIDSDPAASQIDISKLATALETSRCLHAEYEASLHFATTLLTNPTGLFKISRDSSSPDFIPDGICDGWLALVEKSQMEQTNNYYMSMNVSQNNSNPTSTNTMDHTTTTTTAAATSTMDNPSSQSSQVVEYALPRGQLGKAVKNLALASTLQNVSQLAKQIIHHENEDTIPFTYHALPLLYDSMASMMEHENKKLSNTSSVSTSTPDWFMKAYYDRIQETREYHALHQNATLYSSDNSTNNSSNNNILPSSILNDDELFHNNMNNTNTPTFIHPIIQSGGNSNSYHSNNKRRKLGHPAADGYDLYSHLSSNLDKVTSGQLFSIEEVMGKYLDLISIHQNVISTSLHTLFQNYRNQSTPTTTTDQTSTTTTTTTDNSTMTTTTTMTNKMSYPDFCTLIANGIHKVIPESIKLNQRKKYIRFLDELKTYLISFVSRVSPLLDLENEVIHPALQEFEIEWYDKGGIPGIWECKDSDKKDMTMKMSNYSSTTTTTSGKDDDSRRNNYNKNSTTDDDNNGSINLKTFSTVEDLMKHTTPDQLKVELSRLGMKIGGTPLDRAKRLWMSRDTPLDQLPSKLFTNNKNITPITATATAATTTTTTNNDIHNTKASTLTTTTTKSGYSRKDMASLETIVMALLDQIRPALDATTRRAERRMTQTTKEKDQELDEELSGISLMMGGTTTTNNKENEGEKKKNDDSDDEDDDEEETPIYNPKGVPLGWDGKPIPYWLFKLHGLNHFYPCEICGNESYRGRRNFEKHFTEAKHTYGMRCLGIPNTKHFHGVTSIEDAQNLWKKLQANVKKDIFDGSKEEEYEDSHGNVLSRATYEDLARQGLL